jgi:4-hydroxybenzoate polyprenyltransferase
MHALTAASLLALGVWMGLAWPYYVGWTASAALLVYEHQLVKPDDLSRLNMAFFNVNGYIAVVMFISTLGAMYV